jgi:small-conductance mechanosensitive channel
MWGWILDNAIWILIVASAVVVVLLLFNGVIRRIMSLETGATKHPRLHDAVNVIFWAGEGVAAVIMLLAFIAMAITPAGNGVSGNVSAAAAHIDTTAIQDWFLGHGFRVLVIFIVGIVLWVVARQTIPPFTERVIGRPKRGESKEGVKRRAATLEGVFLGLARVLIILLVLFMILVELNVNIGPVLAGLGVVGIAVGFGAQYLIRDLIAGVFIIMENQYRVGDVAKVADVAGQVEEINLRKTVLRDLDGIVHHIPNGEIRVASNYSRHFARVNLDISVSYGTDLNRAIEVINKVCNDMAEEDDWKKVIRSTPQVLRVNKLGDSGIDLKIVGDVKPLEQWSVTGELRLRIKNEFDRVGIEIPWPHTKVYFGNKPGDA